MERYWTDYDGKGGQRVPTRLGGRLITLHTGWEKGLIPNLNWSSEARVQETIQRNERHAFHAVVQRQDHS